MKNTSILPTGGLGRLFGYILLAVAIFAILPHAAFADTATINSTSMFASPDTSSGGGLIYTILEFMRWVFSLLYVVSVYYLIKAAKSYSDEQYDKMWAQIGATVFYAIIPTIAHIIWYIGTKANAQSGTTTSVFSG